LLLARSLQTFAFPRVVLLSLLGSLAFVLAALMLVDSFIFFPERQMPHPPAGVEERWITTGDGLRIHAWYAGAPAEGPTLVWSHGNGGNIAGRAGVLLELHKRGMSVLAYDYRGYGKSEGRPTEAGVYGDVLAAYDSLRERGVPAARIICFGESLGGAVSIYLASQRPCAGVAVVSTFTTLRDVARSHFGPLALLAGDRFDSLRRIATLSVPLFVAHGERDEIVPFHLGEQLYAAAREPKQFLRIPWAQHNDVFTATELLDRIAKFAHQAAGAR
jgi:fermentation-respiration switch protein FrsA (DUF1100 family)